MIFFLYFDLHQSKLLLFLLIGSFQETRFIFIHLQFFFQFIIGNTIILYRLKFFTFLPQNLLQVANLFLLLIDSALQSLVIP